VQYRRFGQLDFQVSALGFGTMRLPYLPNEAGDCSDVDEPQATEMVHHAIDCGVNYVDTAYPYHEGNSERFLGRALMGGYRGRVKLATKLPCWLVETPGDFDKLLDEQLEKLQTDHIDFYLLHALWRERWDKMQKMDVFAWAEKARADGRIGHLGFSFHGTLPLFKEVIDTYDWAMCQIQYNLLNEDVQVGTEGLEYAAEKGVAVAIMEPLMGGALADPPDAAKAVWDAAGANLVDVALRWLWNKPQVSVVLSGMSAPEQVRQNLESAEESGVGALSPEELDLVARVQEAYKGLESIPCTKCAYCMPCPNGVNIPRNFELYNQAAVYGNASLSKALYNGHMPKDERADACIACGECEEQCPQQIEISDWMGRVHETLVIEENA
jgi:predicted aldo/keto reductase-like oxidoreductase